MKLCDYLKQFEGLDPEMEIWKFGNEGYYQLREINDVHTFRFINNSMGGYPRLPNYTCEKSEFYNKKVIVLY